MPKRKYIPKEGHIVMVKDGNGLRYHGEVRVTQKGLHRFTLHLAPFIEFNWCWDDKSIKVTRLVEAR